MEPLLVECESMNVLFVVVMLHAVGKIPKLRAQLAPEAMGHRQVLAHVMSTCPKVLPSFIRLEKKLRHIAQECLTREFEFKQFLHAENLPANLQTVKDMLHCEESRRMLHIFVMCIFAEVSGLLGTESLEGSLYMTEERFAKFRIGTDALRLLSDGGSVDEVYDKLLETHAEACGLPFNSRDPEARAMVRLACLAQLSDPGDHEEVRRTFRDLDNRQRAALIKYLNADGIRERPGFILCDTPAFLASARNNREVGLLPATKILLRVYESADKEFHGTSAAVITIQLGKLTTFAKEFFGAVAFQDMPFSLERQHETEALVLPRVWIPVTSSDLLASLRSQALELAGEVLKSKISEDVFKSRIGRIFPELNYFHTAVYAQREQTLAAMLSIYWLVADQHEAFIRSQGQEEQLSKQSWAWIQTWMAKTVKLSTPDVVDAALVFMAIHALGKIKEFREELSTAFPPSMHDIALAQILNSTPQLVPSFSRLEHKYQQLIVDSLSVDFEFSQFLQAENTPSNLVVIKEKMKAHGDEGFAFFCFRIFAQMCGKLGPRSLLGSVFMNEAQFQRFKPGLEALMELKTKDPLETYNSFLLLRGSKAMSRFASPEHQALSRLLTLSAAYDRQAGHAVCDAFDQLTSEERYRLTRWLNSDGITPGTKSFVLCDAPRFLQNAKANRSVGLCAALRMLLRVQELCAEVQLQDSHRKVVVNLGSIAEWAKDARLESGDFLMVQLSLQCCDAQDDAKIMTIEVIRPVPTSNMQEEEDPVSRPTQSRCSAWCGSAQALLLASILVNAIAVCLNFSDAASAKLLPDRRLRFPTALFLNVVAALLAVLLFRRLCGREAQSDRSAPAVTTQDVGPREPFLRLDTWSLHPRALSRQGRHEYSRLKQTDDDDLV